jgi:hypothetical protein
MNLDKTHLQQEIMAVCVAMYPMYRLDYAKSGCWGFGHNLRGKTCVERLWISVNTTVVRNAQKRGKWAGSHTQCDGRHWQHGG